MTDERAFPEGENPNPSGDSQADGKNPAPSENNRMPAAKPGEPQTDDPFPDTSRHPGFISVFDPETFGKAGLDPLDTLKARYTSYASIKTDAEALRTSLDGDQWNVVMTKAKIGGLVTVGKYMTQGSKAAVARDFWLSEDTANRYEKLYKFLPWSYAAIRKQAADAAAAGKDYQYSIDHIISEGEEAAKRAGATVRRAKYFGSGKCLLIDPAERSAMVQDLPTNFSVSKVKRRHWAEIEKTNLAAGARVWREIDKDVGDSGLRYLEINDTAYKARRLIVARISKKNEVLELGNTERLIAMIDFDAREPQPVRAFSIDPREGQIRRGEVKDDLIIRAGVDPVGLGEALEGLHLHQTDAANQFLFTLAGQQFRGPSILIALEHDSQWLSPVPATLSVGDVAQHVSFITYRAIKAAANEPVEDASEAYELLDDKLVRTYFSMPPGWNRLHPLYVGLTELDGKGSPWNGELLRVPGENAKVLDFARVVAGKTVWNVPKLRALVADVIRKETAPKPPPDIKEARQPLHIPLIEADVIRTLEISLDELTTHLISNEWLGEGDNRPTDEAENSGYAWWNGEQWLWSVRMLRSLIEGQKTRPAEPAENIVLDSVAPAEPKATELDASDGTATPLLLLTYSGEATEAVPDDPTTTEPSTAETEEHQPDQPPIFSFSEEPSSAQDSEETEATPDQPVDRTATLGQNNRQLRRQLADSERRRVTAEERVELLHAKIRHLTLLTPRTKILDYTITIFGEHGRRAVWRSEDADRIESASS